MIVFLQELKVHNGPEFSQCVIRIFQETLEQHSKLRKDSKEWEIESGIFLERCLRLVQHMVDAGESTAALHALVTIKTVHRLQNTHFREERLQNAHEELDALIRAYTTEEIDENCKAFSTPRAKETGRLTNGDQVSFGSLKWRSRRPALSRTYHDFASATRTLRSAYFDRKYYEYPCKFGSTDEYDFPWEDDLDPYVCFHRSSVDLLEWLQRKAWSEIRSKVMLTTGTLLPAELNERVFELALKSEDIPFDPSVKGRATLDSTDFFRRRKTWNRKTYSRCCLRVKDLYRCEGFEDLDDEMSWDDDPEYECVDLQGTFMHFADATNLDDE